MSTAILLIDNSNIHIGTMRMFDDKTARFSYPAFEKRYCDYVIPKKYIFGSTPPKNDSFWGTMRERGYEVRTYERKTYAGGTREKGVDGACIGRGVEAIMNYRPDVVVLLSGDLDMLELIKIAKENGCEVHVWSYKESLAPEMELESDKCFYIDNFLDDLIYFQTDSGTETYQQYKERRRREQEEKAQRKKELQEQEQLRQEKEQEEKMQRRSISEVIIGVAAILGLGVIALIKSVSKSRRF